MAYVDPNFQVATQEGIIGGVNNFFTLGTTTASGTNTFAVAAGSSGNGGFLFPKWIQPTQVKNLRVYIGTAPASNVTAATMTFLNGTNTVGQAVIGTNTAGVAVDATMTALSTDSHGVVTGGPLFTGSNGQMSVTVTAVGTASGQALGSYAIDALLQNYFAG